MSAGPRFDVTVSHQCIYLLEWLTYHLKECFLLSIIIYFDIDIDIGIHYKNPNLDSFEPKLLNWGSLNDQ